MIASTPTPTAGQRAYQDYFNQRQGLNSQGNPMPAWEDLSPELHAWWAKAGVVPPGAPPWWRNKVLWMNVVVLVLATAETQIGLLKDVLPGGVFAWVAFGLPLANAAARGFNLMKAAQA